MQFARQRAALPRHSFPSLLLALGGCLVVTVGGCRTTADNQIDLLERELRTQEDYIYELEDYVLEYSQKLRQCRCTTPHPTVIYSEPDQVDPPRKSNSTTTKRQLPKDDPIEPRKIEPPADELPLPPEPEPDAEEPASEALEDLDIPDLEIGDPVGELNRRPSIEQVAAEEWIDEPNGVASSADELVFLPDPATFADDDQVEQVSDEQFADDFLDEAESPHDEPHRVARQLEITQLFRGAGDSTAPTSLLTIVEALDGSGEPVDLDGEVSLMVMTANPDSPQRLKRWNFSPEETASAWQSSSLGDGLHLELPLDAVELPDMPLELWARLVLADGRKLLTQIAFEPPQLAALDQQMQPDKLPPVQESQLAMTDAEPIDDDDAKVENQLRRGSRRASLEQRPEDDKPRWRASMQRTDFVTQSYSTTVKGGQRWTAQPLGGLSVAPALARRPVGQSPAAPTTDESSSSSEPTWQPYR